MTWEDGYIRRITSLIYHAYEPYLSRILDVFLKKVLLKNPPLLQFKDAPSSGKSSKAKCPDKMFDDIKESDTKLTWQDKRKEN